MFRQKYLNVYIKGDFEGAEEFLQGKFQSEVGIGKWRDGYSIKIDTEDRFEDLVKWLGL